MKTTTNNVIPNSLFLFKYYLCSVFLDRVTNKSLINPLYGVQHFVFVRVVFNLITGVNDPSDQTFEIYIILSVKIC